MNEPFPHKFAWVRALSDPNSGITSTQHHVALALAEWLNQEGEGYVTHRQLAIMTRMSERSICDALTALADARWLERQPGKVGRATTYRIAKKPGWKPTPKEEMQSHGKRKRRTPVNKDVQELARKLIMSVYSQTGIDQSTVDNDTETARRLLGVMRRQCSSPASEGSGLHKIYEVLIDGELTTAHDPAAVLLARYKKALRNYPHLRPVKEIELVPEVRAAIDAVIKGMNHSVPK